MDFASLAAQINTGTILPELVVIATLMVVLIADLISGRASWKWTPYFAVGGLIAAVASLTLQWDSVNPIGFLGGFNSDALSLVFRGIIALSAAVTILMSVTYVEQ